MKCGWFTTKQTGHQCTRRAGWIVTYDNEETDAVCWQHVRDLPWPVRRITQADIRAAVALIARAS